jgi:exopolysaccharide biosynthesis polyprenyl glycosylphosphotransferase
MRFGQLRALVTLVQLLCVVIAQALVFALIRALGGVNIPLLSDSRTVLYFTGLFTLLWMAQLFLLWNPSEFTSNKNLFRPTSIGKSSVVVALALLILSGIDRSSALVALGFLFVALGAGLLLVGYSAIRHWVRKTGNEAWLSQNISVLAGDMGITAVANILGRPLSSERTVPPQLVSAGAGSHHNESTSAPSVPVAQSRGADTLPHTDALVLGPDHGLSTDTLKSLLRDYQRSGTDAVVLTSLGAESAERVELLLLHDETAILVHGNKQNPWFRVVKRTMDIVFSALALVVFAPIMALIAIAIRLDSPGNAVFASQRIGRDNAPFTFFKFRSMTNGAHLLQDDLYRQRPDLTNGVLFKDKKDSRLTRLGAFLRRSSLDELPQFWNVLRGDMSLVGPRPHVAIEVEKFPDHAVGRMRVPPGMTGLWQVNGRSLLSQDESINLDLLYVSSQSIWLDITILARTIPAVLGRRGAF